MKDKESLPIGEIGQKKTSGLNFSNTGEGKAGGKTLTSPGPTEKSGTEGKSPLKK